jgi:hypothetical protein
MYVWNVYLSKYDRETNQSIYMKLSMFAENRKAAEKMAERLVPVEWEITTTSVDPKSRGDKK